MPWPKIRRTIQKIGHEAGSPIRRLTHFANDKTHSTYALFNFVVGPCANVFLMNQIRVGKLWSGLSSTSGGKTAAQIGMFMAPVAIAEGLKKGSHVKYRRMTELNRETTTLEEAYKAVCSYNGSRTQLIQTVVNQSNAVVHGANMANCVALPLTLMDVYSKSLNGSGMIESNAIFGVYVALTVAGFAYFYGQRYTENCDYNEQEARELLASIWQTVKRENNSNALPVNADDSDEREKSSLYDEQQSLIPNDGNSSNVALEFKAAVEQVFNDRNLIDSAGILVLPDNIKPYELLNAIEEKTVNPEENIVSVSVC